MRDIAIKVENLGKKYIIRHEKQEPYKTFQDALIQGSKKIITSLNPFAPKNMEGESSEEFWALKDVNFEIKQGDKVGIIGRNGAGKSTLLKVLSRITEPTTGKIHINGRIASLLEVGTGFHPELTGRENIYLNGAILGMSRAEIKRKFDDIVAFAEVEKFLDTPVKRYSSGMYVRLAFSVAAHLEPEILVVDEVLAVGDVEFQKKCLGKMGEVSKEGRTILFVSHNMSAIASLCNKTMVLRNGMVEYYGDTQQGIQLYLNPTYHNDVLDYKQVGPLSKVLNFQSIKINGFQGQGITISPKEEIVFELDGEAFIDFEKLIVEVIIIKDGIDILKVYDVPEPKQLCRGRFRSKMKIPAYFLRPGYYTVSVGATTGFHGDWSQGTQIADFVISEEWDKKNPQIGIGFVNVPFHGQRECLK